MSNEFFHWTFFLKQNFVNKFFETNVIVVTYSSTLIETLITWRRRVNYLF